MREEGRRLEEVALFWLHILYTMSKSGQPITPGVCVQDVPGTNIGRGIDYRASGFFSSFSVLQANEGVLL
jgi:hypothetical protein